MSGIYIPDMEMPKNCYECRVRNQGFSGNGMKCGKTGSVLSWYDGNRKRMDDCPLVPAAYVRPVVFCKNCMHSVQGKKSLECEKHRYVWNNMNRWVNDEDFCCWGAKREES